MRKNCMAEVAKLLGVELEEVFCIDGDEHYFRLTDTGLGMLMRLGSKDWLAAPINVLYGLLLGENEIIKLPWKPKYDEEYYIPSISNAISYNHFYWKGDALDDRCYNLGVVFKSKEEAVAMTKKMLAVAKEVKENG